MRKLLILSLATLISVSLFAQKAHKMRKHTMKVASTPVKGTWTRGANFYAGLTQVGNNNWYTTGSDKFTMTVMSTLDAWVTDTRKKSKWSSGISAAYGLLNTTHTGVTKLNDRLELGTKFLVTPSNSKNWGLGPRLALRTQFSNGYFYNYMGEEGVKRRKSGFFAPAYVTASIIGANFEPCKHFSVYLSPLTARWVVVTNKPYSYLAQGGIYKGTVEDPLARLYNVSPTKQHRGEFGLLAVAKTNFSIMKNISYMGRLELFGNLVNSYSDALPTRFANIETFMINEVSMHVNRYIRVKYNLDLLYDDNIKQPNNNANSLANRSVGLQLLSTLGVGVSFGK